MNYFTLIKAFIPYIFILSIAGYIYYQDKRIESLKAETEQYKENIQILKDNQENQKKYFEDKIEQQKFKVKYIEKKTQIENKVKKDENDKNKSNINRFYLDN